MKNIAFLFLFSFSGLIYGQDFENAFPFCDVLDEIIESSKTNFENAKGESFHVNDQTAYLALVNFPNSDSVVIFDSNWGPESQCKIIFGRFNEKDEAMDAFTQLKKDLLDCVSSYYEWRTDEFENDNQKYYEMTGLVNGDDIDARPIKLFLTINLQNVQTENDKYKELSLLVYQK